VRLEWAAEPWHLAGRGVVPALPSRAMEQRISMVTLGVADLERSRTFYQDLGWRGRTVQSTVFFQTSSIVIVLWDRRDLAADVGLLDAVSGDGFSGIALAHNVRSRSEVDAVIRAAESAGAQVSRRPAETFYGGYAGYFRDPDGHVWEVAWNPAFTLDDSGVITLPDLGAEG
jgi:predicted lactoylglutathione lyase